MGLKNFIEVLPEFGLKVDFFATEATRHPELECYRMYGKPVVRMYYNRGAKIPAFVFPVVSGKDGNRF
ncbi:MAG: hypothetical protein P1V20_25730 [Verrucomicrobiales bacterium]|nr:hypothetical protein [Verrucomicrobiales bacterium]